MVDSRTAAGFARGFGLLPWVVALLLLWPLDAGAIEAPVNVQASDKEFLDRVHVTWDPVEGAEFYRIFRQDFFSFSVIGGPTDFLHNRIGTATETSFDDFQAGHLITFIYSVKAVDAEGNESALSMYDSGLRKPWFPTNLQATDGSSIVSVTVSWETIPNAIFSNRIFRATSEQGLKTLIHTTVCSECGIPRGAVMSFADTTAEPGIVYHYWTAFQYFGSGDQYMGDSELSNSDTGFRAINEIGTPTGVAASDGTFTDKVRVTWNAASGATSYRIFRSVSGPASTAPQIGTSSTSSFDDTALEADVVHNYWVKAVNPGGDSDFSEPDSGFRAVAPAKLDSSSSENYIASGPLGGPFIPGTKSFVLQNTGDPVLNYSVVPSATWISSSPSSGAIGPNSSVSVSLRIDGSTLPSGLHRASVEFRNNSDPADTLTVSVELTVLEGRRLTASDGDRIDAFGKVAIEDQILVVGALNNSNESGLHAGAAYVFLRNDSLWQESAKLVSSERRNSIGFSAAVDVSGSTIAVGADRVSDSVGDNVGAVFIFRPSDGVWQQQARIQAADREPRDQFGLTLSLDRNRLAVGAILGDNTAGSITGVIYIFERQGGDWVQVQKITPSDGEEGQEFSRSVSLKENYLAVSSSQALVDGLRAGAVYIYLREGGKWVEQTRIESPEPEENGLFGFSTSLAPGRLAVGAIGKVFIYELANGEWRQTAKLVSGRTGDGFGTRLSLDGDRLVVGASSDNTKGSGAGASYVFRLDGGVWRRDPKLTAANGASADRFGGSVAISGGTVVVGANGYDRNANDTNVGAVFVFDASPDAQPANDAFASPGILSGPSMRVFGNNAFATREANEPNHSGKAGVDSVWWEWTAPFSGTAKVKVVDSIFDTLLGVYSGTSVSSLTRISSASGFQGAEASFAAIQNQRYRIAVDSGDRGTGRFLLSVLLEPDTKMEIAADLGVALGLWIYKNDAEWEQISDQSASKIALADINGDGVKEMVVAYGDGIWLRDTDGAWRLIDDRTVKHLAVGDLDSNGVDDVVADFGEGIGVWAWMNGAAWEQVRSETTRGIVITNFGDGTLNDVIMNLDDERGTWIIRNAKRPSPVWYKLNVLSPKHMAVGDMDGGGHHEIIMDLAPHGIWIKRNNEVWEKINSATSEVLITGDLDGNDRADVIVDFGNPYGVWHYLNDAGPWVKINSSSPEIMTAGDIDFDGRDEIIASFGPGFGVWIFSLGEPWTRLNINPATAIATGDIDGQ